MPEPGTIHEQFMHEALVCAQRAWGDTHPNPMVGAVIVEDGVVVADGYHERAGDPHAEVMALKNLGRPPAKDAILYVTLEPCSTTGRTPPCTQRIIESGISKVVIGAIDPNPAHAGAGLDILLDGGLSVTSGVLAEACEDINLIFNHQMRTGRPLFAAKIATTLDGKIATRQKQSKWITGKSARRDVMLWRRYFPAIAVAAGTVLADDPSLTARLDNQDEHCPQRFIFDRDLRTLAAKPQVLHDVFCDKTTLICAPDAPDALKQELDARGLNYWEIPHPNNRPCVESFRKLCLANGIHGVLFEGGHSLLSYLLEKQALDYLFHYRAPKLLADEESISPFTGRNAAKMEDAITLERVRHAMLADDQLIRGFMHYPDSNKNS